MNSIKKQLAINRFAWMFEGEFWTTEDREEAIDSTHTRRMNADLAENKARKMVEGYEQKQEKYPPKLCETGIQAESKDLSEISRIGI